MAVPVKERWKSSCLRWKRGRRRLVPNLISCTQGKSSQSSNHHRFFFFFFISAVTNDQIIFSCCCWCCSSFGGSPHINADDDKKKGVFCHWHQQQLPQWMLRAKIPLPPRLFRFACSDWLGGGEKSFLNIWLTTTAFYARSGSPPPSPTLLQQKLIVCSILFSAARVQSNGWRWDTIYAEVVTFEAV